MSRGVIRLREIEEYLNENKSKTAAIESMSRAFGVPIEVIEERIKYMNFKEKVIRDLEKE